MPLTDVAVRNARGAERDYKMTDGEGMYLLVKTDGGRYWRMDYRHLGKRKTLAIGVYPAVSLAAARGKRAKAREALANGLDPGAEKKREIRAAKVAAAHTFEAVANEWFEAKKGRWVESYSSRLRSRLDDDLLPALGRRPIAEIEPAEVLDALRKIEDRGALEMARRIKQMASSVFCYGVATSRCQRDPTTDLRGALKARGEVRRRASLPAKDLPELYAKFRTYEGDVLTVLALKFVLLTFVRTSELRFAEWSEFEFENRLWRISAAKMKMRRDHLVPLADQTLALLAELRKHTGRSRYLFPGNSKTSDVISENTMLYALYRMGYHSRATVHGFRSTASTVLNEQNFAEDWIEMQLAHHEDDVRSAYNAAEWLPGRREMMQWWADYLDQQALDPELADLLG